MRIRWTCCVDLMKGEHLQPEYRALNPNAMVPMLEDDGFRLTESAAIVRYLAEKTGSAAYPKDLRARARIEEMIAWFYSNYYKDLGYGLVYPQLFPHHKRRSEEAHAGAIAWGKQRSEHWLAILDLDIIGPHRKFLCGDAVTLADYVGAEMVAIGEAVRCRYDDYPNVRRWIDNMKALEHWPEIHHAAESFAASLIDMEFVSI